MNRRATLLGGSIVVALLTPVLVLGHPDDPKIYDRQPPYAGPGWRAGQRSDPPPFDASHITLQSWITVTEFDPSFTAANDCWGYVSPSGREYAIIGLSGGTGFVDITDPANPNIITVLTGPTSSWRDIKIYQDHAYAVSEGGTGIQVFDLSVIDSGTVTQVNTITTGGTTATHNVAIDTVSGYLYRTGGSNNGLRIYDLADPANPVHVADWTDRYVHDAQIVTYTNGPYAGRQIAFCASGFNGGWDETGVDILDVTDKQNIVPVSRVFYSSGNYSHQLWLSEDRRLLYLNDELDEQNTGSTTTTRVLDVSDIEAPFESTTYTNGNTSIDHNLYTKGSMIFAANYRSGLRVFDATDPTSPVEVAYFDTYPDSDSANFNGLWSNYPYFPSGTIIGSDIERGLFVWTIDEYPLSIYYPDGRPDEMSGAGMTLRVDLVENVPGTLAAATPTLHYDAGAGLVSVALTPLGGNQYQATFPAAPCGSSISWYITASAIDDTEVQSPVGAPVSAYTLDVVGTEIQVMADDFESAATWQINFGGTDDATTGIWMQGDPIGTAAQPEDDHTVGIGTDCWFTGQGTVGGGIGDNDVDGGATTLTSVALALSAADNPMVRFYLWYSNNQGGAPNSDTFEIDISNDDGGSWSHVETVGPSGAGTGGGWVLHEFFVTDFVALTDQVRIRFSASDLGSGSIVEAAVDDFEIVEEDCGSTCPGDLDASGGIDLTDLGLLLGNYGMIDPEPADGDLNNDNAIDLTDLGMLLASYGESCP